MKFAHNAKTHRGHDAKIYECLQCGRYDVVGVNFATGAPMILSSGFNKEELTERIARQAPAGFIRKPYNMSALEAELRRVVLGE